MSYSLHPDQAGHFVVPDLCPNCLQRLYQQTTLASKELNVDIYFQMPPGQQPAPQYGNQYGGMPQRHPSPLGMGRGPGPGPGPMKNNMMAMYQRRANSAPYMNPQQMMQAKRSQYPNGTQVSVEKIRAGGWGYT